MGKIKQKLHDMPFRLSFILYVTIFAIIAIVLMAITASFCQSMISNIRNAYPANEEWYYLATAEGELLGEEFRVWKTDTIYTDADEFKMRVFNAAIYLCMPIYFMACLSIATALFYRNKMSRPLAVLQEAHEKISSNDLDFKIEYTSKDEMGKLCDSFEIMRAALLRNNQKMWWQMEQRRHLNAAFAHDLRTPLTVLKGYAEILEIEGDTPLTKEKAATMNRHISRLERYVESMSSLQKLDDIEPAYHNVKSSEIWQAIEQAAALLCEKSDTELIFASTGDNVDLVVDSEMILGVIDNLVSNAARYANSKIWIEFGSSQGFIEVAVEDDGNGFSHEALQRATEPFYTENTNRTDHFGLGLHICRIMCERHGGSLRISNGSTGARAVAKFKAISR